MALEGRFVQPILKFVGSSEPVRFGGFCFLRHLQVLTKFGDQVVLFRCLATTDCSENEKCHILSYSLNHFLLSAISDEVNENNENIIREVSKIASK